jgi:hypothetical protein
MKNFLSKFVLTAALVLALTAPALAQTGPTSYRTTTINGLLQIKLYGTSGVAWVGGGSAVDDGLGGVFFYDSTSSASTNVYFVFKPVSNSGRWFKLPTAVANQESAVTVGDDTTYAWKLMRAGQTNFLGFGADNNIAYVQTFNGKNLHINYNGNSTVFNGGGSGAVQFSGTTVTVGSAGTAFKAIYSAAGELDFPSISANAVTNLTITVAGAGTNSAVAVSKADGSLTAGIELSAYVSATNTVTVRAANPTVTAIDPATGSYRVTVFQY